MLGWHSQIQNSKMKLIIKIISTHSFSLHLQIAKPWILNLNIYVWMASPTAKRAFNIQSVIIWLRLRNSHKICFTNIFLGTRDLLIRFKSHHHMTKQNAFQYNLHFAISAMYFQMYMLLLQHRYFKVGLYYESFLWMEEWLSRVKFVS